MIYGNFCQCLRNVFAKLTQHPKREKRNKLRDVFNRVNKEAGISIFI